MLTLPFIFIVIGVLGVLFSLLFLKPTILYTKVRIVYETQSEVYIVVIKIPPKQKKRINETVFQVIKDIMGEEKITQIGYRIGNKITILVRKEKEIDL
jgi:hypothetical protein